MQVNGAGSIPGSVGVQQPRPAADVPQTTAARPVAPRDEVEISTAGKMLDELNQSPEVRAERLTQIKAAIEAGEYETPEKLEAALEKLLQHVSANSDQDE